MAPFADAGLLVRLLVGHVLAEPLPDRLARGLLGAAPGVLTRPPGLLGRVAEEVPRAAPNWLERSINAGRMASKRGSPVEPDPPESAEGTGSGEALPSMGRRPSKYWRFTCMASS